jgi:SAM-dependent methyltransferase
MLHSMSMKEPYGYDLAYVHDAGFGDLARNAATVLLRALTESGRDRGLVVDLCCGSGLLARELLSAGYEVLGIDISGALLALARERVPDSRFREESILSAEIPACVAVAATGECFNYLFDENNSRETLHSLLRRIHTALEPGGLLIFDAAEPGRVPGSGPHQSHAQGQDWAVLASAEEDRANETLTRKITTFRKVGDLYRRSEETHRLHLIPTHELLDQIQALGFEVQTFHRYENLQLPPGLVGFLARKTP